MFDEGYPILEWPGAQRFFQQNLLGTTLGNPVEKTKSLRKSCGWKEHHFLMVVYVCVCVLNYWIGYTVYTHLNICSDSPGSHSRLDPSTTMHHPPSSSSSPSSSPHDSMPRTLPVLERLPLLRACSKTCRYFELKDFSSSETFSDPTQAGRSKLSGRYPLVRPLMGPWASVGWHIMLLVATCS